MAPARLLQSRNASSGKTGRRPRRPSFPLPPLRGPPGATPRTVSAIVAAPSPRVQTRAPGGHSAPRAPPPRRARARPPRLSRSPGVGGANPPSRGRGPARSSPAPSPSDVARAEGAQGRRRRRRETRSSSEAVKSVSFFLSSDHSEVVLKVHRREPPSSPLPPFPTRLQRRELGVRIGEASGVPSAGLALGRSL